MAVHPTALSCLAHSTGKLDVMDRTLVCFSLLSNYRFPIVCSSLDLHFPILLQIGYEPWALSLLAVLQFPKFTQLQVI